MSARGAKKRGRPPKLQIADRSKKYQFHVLKKPKYLQNLGKGSDSQTSTPSTSRPCSPYESEPAKRSAANRSRRKDKNGRKGGMVGSAYARRGYNPSSAYYHDSEYHYGSDFGDDSSDNKSDVEDDVALSGRCLFMLYVALVGATLYATIRHNF